MRLLLCWWTVSAGASIKLTVAKTKHYHNVNNESSSDAGSGRMTKRTNRNEMLHFFQFHGTVDANAAIILAKAEH